MADVPTFYAELLVERLAQARLQRADLISAIDSIRATRRLTLADDEHDPEGSTVSLDQSRQEALLVQTEQTISDLEDARRRLEAGDYGRCEVCGIEIPAERMEVRPDARVCVPCAKKAQRPLRLCR